MRVGVVSDTHGYVNPRLFELFDGVERIMHAGDITTIDVIDELSTIAPVIAVHGNMDYPEIVTRFPEDQRITLADNDIFMTHNGGMLLRSQANFEARVGSRRPDIFIWGHTHRPDNRVIDGMLSLNPGPAGKPRADHPASSAILTLEAGQAPRAEIILLDD
jgi:putative phosphoesterase